MARIYVPIFFDWSETTMDLTQEQKGNLIDAVVDYAAERRSLEQITTELSAIERVAFRFMKGQVDRYCEISDIRSKAGRSKKEQTEAKESKPEQTEAKPIKRFQKPTVEEVAAYCTERGNGINPQHFVDFYESKGWKVGSQPMKDWKASVRTWESKEVKGNGNAQRSGRGDDSAVRVSYSFLKP